MLIPSPLKLLREALWLLRVFLFEIRHIMTTPSSEGSSLKGNAPLVSSPSTYLTPNCLRSHVRLTMRPSPGMYCYSPTHQLEDKNRSQIIQKEMKCYYESQLIMNESIHMIIFVLVQRSESNAIVSYGYITEWGEIPRRLRDVHFVMTGCLVSDSSNISRQSSIMTHSTYRRLNLPSSCKAFMQVSTLL